MHVTNVTEKPSLKFNEELNQGKSKEASFLSITYNSMIVRLTIWKRYRAEAIGSIIQLVILTTFFFLFASAVGFNGFENFGTKEIFIFFMGGFLIMFFDGVSVWGPVNAVSRDLYNGTLEYLYFTPMKKYPYYFGYLVGSVITNVLIAFIPLFTLLIWYADLQLPNITMILLTMTILMFSLLSIGIIVSLSVILFKQVQALVSLLGVIMQFFTGAFIPINSLPQMLAPIAYLFPHTWAYELIRYYSFDGNWNLILPLELNWLLLVFFTVFYTIVALFLQKKVIKHAKQKGLHIL
jgi:ABC-2 type transport system permease protein